MSLSYELFCRFALDLVTLTLCYINHNVIYITQYILDFSLFFFFSSRRRHTRYWRDWSSDVCSSHLFACNPWSAGEWHERPRRHQSDSQRSPPSDFEYADPFAGIDGILKYGASLFRREMMKRREHRSEPLQFRRNFHRVNRVRIVSNAILRRRFGIFECPEVWVFICEPNVRNLKSRRASLELLRLELSRKL